MYLVKDGSQIEESLGSAQGSPLQLEREVSVQHIHFPVFGFAPLAKDDSIPCTIPKYHNAKINILVAVTVNNRQA